MSNPLYLDCLSVSDEVTSGRFKRYVTDQPFTRCDSVFGLFMYSVFGKIKIKNPNSILTI